MNKFKEFLGEEHHDVWKATVRVSKDGKTIHVPIESSTNIRSEAHKKVSELTKQGYKLEGVDYDT